MRKLLGGAALAIVLASSAHAQSVGGGGVSLPVTAANGGTGVSNAGASLTLPAHALTITGPTGTATVTLPGTGSQTLVDTTDTQTVSGAITFSNAGGTTSSNGLLVGNNSFLSSPSNSANQRLVLDSSLGGGFFSGLYSNFNAAMVELDIGANANGNDTASSGLYGGVRFSTALTQTSTAGWYGFRVNPTLTGVGSGVQHAYDLVIGGVTRWYVDVNGMEAAGGTKPTFSGTCAVNVGTGGTRAGVTTTTGACTAGQTVIATFPSGTSAANGWNGTLQDSTTTTDLCPETSTNATSITWTCVLAGSGDSLRWTINSGY